MLRTNFIILRLWKTFPEHNPIPHSTKIWKIKVQKNYVFLALSRISPFIPWIIISNKKWMRPFFAIKWFDSILFSQPTQHENKTTQIGYLMTFFHIFVVNSAKINASCIFKFFFTNFVFFSWWKLFRTSLVWDVFAFIPDFWYRCASCTWNLFGFKPVLWYSNLWLFNIPQKPKKKNFEILKNFLKKKLSFFQKYF